MTTDDGVTSKNTLVNVRLPAEEYRHKNCMFSDSDIIKLYSACELSFVPGRIKVQLLYIATFDYFQFSDT